LADHSVRRAALIAVAVMAGLAACGPQARVARESTRRAACPGDLLTLISAPKVFKVVAFGDSTTAPLAGLKRPYAIALGEDLPNRGIAATVINAGIGGNNTTQARKRLKDDVLDQKPDLVIVQFGINDAMVDVWTNPPATTSRVSKKDYEVNLRDIVRRIRAGGGQVILMTPNPLRWVKYLREHFGKPPYRLDDPQGFTFILRDYAEIVRQIARSEKVPLVDVYTIFEDYGKAKGHAVDDLLGDGVHPNDAGHKIIAERLLEMITSRLGP